jgi:two-component system response regulator YesN
MYTALILDDEMIAVEGVQRSIHWKALGVRDVLPAYCVEDAKSILKDRQVHILIADIEMPSEENGLDLLAWVKRHSPDTVTLIMTCHADFQYAQQAIQLGCIDYLLKPLPYRELEGAIRKAIEKIRKNDLTLDNERYRKLWIQHHAVIIERFWNDIIEHTIPSRMDAIKEEAQLRGIPFSENMIFVPVLIRLQKWHKPLNRRESSIMMYALKNAAQEVFLQRRDWGGHIIRVGPQSLLAILIARDETSEKSLVDCCNEYIESCKAFFYCDLSCYIGNAVTGDQLLGEYGRLNQMDRDNVVFLNKVLLLQDRPSRRADLQLPDFGRWSGMLQERKREMLGQELSEYFECLKSSRDIDADFIRRFQHDFLQMIYSYLHLKGIQAHRFIADGQFGERMEAAGRSVRDLEVWVGECVDKAMAFVQDTESEENVIRRCIAYIRENLGEELTREQVANHVYLNPDYLNRIFKKETGLSLHEYITKERLEKAKVLLRKTNLPISAIAAEVGYDSFSHFSQLFKKYTDLNPKDYRRLG